MPCALHTCAVLNPRHDCCRGVDSSSKELAGLQAEKEGLQKQLSALQRIHTEGQQSSQQEAERLKKASLYSPLHVLQHDVPTMQAPSVCD